MSDPIELEHEHSSAAKEAQAEIDRELDALDEVEESNEPEGMPTVGEDEEVELGESTSSDAVILQLQQEKAELNDQLLRLQAEFINFRRSQEQRLQQDRKYATTRLVEDLIPVMDNFERSIKHLQSAATVEAMLDGIQAVSKQLFGVLQSQGVSKIASVGEHFNPEFHEAIAVVETTEAEDGVILEEIEAGYRISERIVRPARVRVAKN
jgi:molecular chaperone GrpE